MRVPLPQILYGQANQTLVADPSLPYVHVDNPTNARIVFENGQMVGPYTLNAVISIPKTNGSFIVDTSDVSYPNVAIFSNALINAWLTNEEHPNPGISYAPIANISSTITVSGNVNATVTNTINATITNANIPVTQSGVWSVSISNATINVAQSGSWAVTISSGSVNIANASIAVINATGTKITSARPPKFWAFVSNGTTNPQGNLTPALDADVQALVIHLYTAISNLVHLKLQWHGTPDNTVDIPLELYKFTQNIYVIPILPSGRDGAGAQTSVLNITLQGLAIGDSAAEVWELFDAAPMWIQLFPQPQLEPNQVPGAILKTLASTVPQWLISPAANVQISLFELVSLFQTNFGAGDAVHIGHNAVLPPNGGPYPSKLIETVPLGTPFSFPFHGSQLPRGEGIYVVCDLSAAMNYGCYINYSLS